MLSSLRIRWRIGLAALQRDADRHLAQRAAGQRVGPGQRLGTQQHVDAKRTALPHQAVQQQRGVLGDLVVLHEELLELVDDQQHAGQLDVRIGVAVALQVLHALVAEQIAPASQFDVQPLQDAHAKFAFAFDGDHAGVRQVQRSVRFELDALLEIHQVEMDFVRTVVQRQIGDHGVQQGRFAGARLAGDQHVLRGAFSQPQVLQVGRAGAAQRHLDLRAAVQGPPIALRRRHGTKRHLDAAGVLGPFADTAHDRRDAVVAGRLLQGQRQFAKASYGRTNRCPFHSSVSALTCKSASSKFRGSFIF